MHRSPWLSILLVLTVLVTPLGGLLLTPAVAEAAPLAQTAAVDDEIIVIEAGTGRIRAIDPHTAPAYKPVVWDSGADTGFVTVAAGDFNGDGDQELVGIGGVRLKVFDPVVPAGKAAVSFTTTVAAGRAFRLVATGDFDKDGRDEIAVTDFSGSQETLRIYDGGTNATAGEWQQVLSAAYGALWADLSTGDMNADGNEDLILIRSSDAMLTLYSGAGLAAGQLTKLYEAKYNFPWAAVAMGNISKLYNGSEVALSRTQVQGYYDSIIIFRLAGNTLENLPQENTTNRKFDPYFRSLATGDLNGDQDDEIVALRDPVIDKVSLIVLNPNGQIMRQFEVATGVGGNLFKLVRTGDVDGDGRDEILILRGDRIRTYTEPELSNAFVDTTGSFYTAGSVSNFPTMAVANLDGAGMPLGPTLTVTPGSLTFNLEYSQAVTPQTLRVENSGTSTPINWQAQVITASPWLLLSKTSGVTNDTLNVSIDTRAVGPGTYTGTIRFTSNTPGVVNATQDVQVTLNLTGVGMVVTPSRVSFEVEYGNTAEKPVSITSAGGSAQFNWQAAVIDGAAWLSVSPAQGTSPSTMRVIVNATAAGPGVRQGTIRVSAMDPNVANGVQYITVDLNVPDPGFVVLPKQLTFFQERTGPTVTKQISIWRPGGSVNWVASAVDVPTAADVAALAADGKLIVTEQGLTVEGVDAEPTWLIFSPSSGTTQPNVPSIMNVSVRPGTANGRYHAVITIVADDPTLANRIQTVEVTAIVVDDVKVLFLPFVLR